MTTRELRCDVSALCFTDVGEKDGRFIAYANLALRTIYNELTIIGKRRLYPVSVLPSFYTDRILHKGGETVSVSLCGRAYSFLAVGKGSVTVDDGRSVKQMEFDTEGTAIRGFLASPATLTLSGEYAFSIYSLAVFSELSSENESDIPLFERSPSFDLRELVKDFGGFVGPPKDCRGNTVTNAVYSDGVLTLPDFTGSVIELEYRRIPRRIYIDLPDEEIDIPEEYSPLLVWLCAYYLCLEDEREIAEDHLAHYKELLGAIKANSAKGRGIDYIDTHGWA